jgi:hypothetical protein
MANGPQAFARRATRAQRDDLQPRVIIAGIPCLAGRNPWHLLAKSVKFASLSSMAFLADRPLT